jgi:IclR family pca regulon transcriptional regulator
MPREGTGPDFIEALARGLEVITAFEPGRPTLSLSEVAAATGLARPTARRILLTLQELGYVRPAGAAGAAGSGYALTPRVLDLGVAYVRSMNLWDVARPHMETLSARTDESCSIAQLDGSDIVYVARVAVPKIVSLAVQIGTRFPALQTSLGKVLLAALGPGEIEQVLAEPSRSGITPRWQPDRAEREAELRQVRARGWALTDEQLTRGIRSVAAPLRNGSGQVIAALNVNTHAAETPVEQLLDHHLPLLLQAAGEISADFARVEAVPHVTRAVG